MTQTAVRTQDGHDRAEPPTPTRAPLRHVLTWLGLVALIASAAVGSNMFSVRDRLLGAALPEPVRPVTSRVAGMEAGSIAADPTALRSAPWWQDVTTIEGLGVITSSFTVERSAIQWRMTSSCESGRLLVRVPGEPRPLIDAACSDTTVAYGNRTGATTFEVNADGPWRLQVVQQIDTPLVEPPLPGMTSPGGSAIATGSFYKVDRTAVGRVTIFDQADGRYTVRLDDFFVSPDTQLQLRLSTAEEPKTSEEYLAGRSQLLAVLDVTAGSLNYLPPVGVDPTEFRSVVIWRPPTNSAFAAATLEPAT